MFTISIEKLNKTFGLGVKQPSGSQWILNLINRLGVAGAVLQKPP